MSNALVLPSSLGIQETSIAEPVSVDISSRDNSPLAKPSSGTMLPLDVAGGVHGMPDYISSQNKSAPSLDRKRSLEEEIGCQEEAGGQEGVVGPDLFIIHYARTIHVAHIFFRCTRMRQATRD
ncbi:hypothetical protein BDV93DRAFT_235867 [Ceratobasidium sp. AG-I]|nr:hypothetical protein BDV93DRAFT_235867 [Ceratobasidium sp. AG-I]